MSSFIKLLIFWAYVRIVYTTDQFLLKQSPVYGISKIASFNRNDSCSKDLAMFLDGVHQKHTWALKALDASGQPVSGFFWGNSMWLGSETECYNILNDKPLEINHKKSKYRMIVNVPYPPYDLHFIVVTMIHNDTLQQYTRFPAERQIILGVCVPKSCSMMDVKYLLNEYFSSGYLELQQINNFSVEIQDVKDTSFGWNNALELVLLPKTIALICIYSLTLLLVLSGTLYDMMLSKPRLKIETVDSSSLKKGSYTLNKVSVTEGPKKSTAEDKIKRINSFGSILIEICQSFSLYRNFKSFFSTKTTPDALEFIYGLRLLLTIWVVAVHVIIFSIDYYDNFPDGLRLSEAFILQPLMNPTYSVDGFLFLSGFLLCYQFFKSHGRNVNSKDAINYKEKCKEYIICVLSRFLRLTPAHMVLVVTADVAYTYIRKYSLFYPSEMVDEMCPKYWWRNLLYINNLFPRREMCVYWTWYLSVDMQLHYVAAFLLILSTICFKLAATCTILMLFISPVSLGIASYFAEFIPTVDEQLTTLDSVYDFPWQRMGPYVVGCITAYVLIIKLEWEFKISKVKKAICWIVFLFINLYILFGTYGKNFSVLGAAFYLGLSRVSWGFGLGWLFIACCTNNGDIVNKILARRAFLPLSKLTYCVYLTNPLIVTVFATLGGSSPHISVLEVLIGIFGMLIINFFVAFWFSMFFEMPYMYLTKMVLPKITRTNKKKEENNN